MPCIHDLSSADRKLLKPLRSFHFTIPLAPFRTTPRNLYISTIIPPFISSFHTSLNSLTFIHFWRASLSWTTPHSFALLELLSLHNLQVRSIFHLFFCPLFACSTTDHYALPAAYSTLTADLSHARCASTGAKRTPAAADPALISTAATPLSSHTQPAPPPSKISMRTTASSASPTSNALTVSKTRLAPRW